MSKQTLLPIFLASLGLAALLTTLALVQTRQDLRRQASAAPQGIWISPERLMSLPTSGQAWDHLLTYATGNPGTPDLVDQNQDHNIYVLAKAFVYARTNQSNYRTEVAEELTKIIGTECSDPGNINCPDRAGARSLSLGRNLAGYVIAADLIDLPSFNPSFDQNTFRPWLQHMMTRVNSEGRSLTTCNEERPNNWGLVCGFSRATISRYFGDNQDLARIAQVFKGWLGDRNSYASFTYKDLSWQCDESKPVGVNPQGCTKNGHNIDGAQPEEQRRCGTYSWPPCKTEYPWAALAGALPQAVVLHEAGYTDVFNWENQGLNRAIYWLYNTTFADGSNNPGRAENEWVPFIANYYYQTDYSAIYPARVQADFGFTDWTHFGSITSSPIPTPTPTPTPLPGCFVSNSTSWQSQAFSPQTGSFTVSFSTTPNASNMDGATGLSSNSAVNYTDLAAIVRFNPDGYIDARNGSSYQSDSQINYTSGNTYYFTLDININSGTYTASINPPPETTGPSYLIADNYSFRTEQSSVSTLSYWNLFSASGSHTVCNFQLISTTPIATPTPSPTPTPTITPTATPPTFNLADLNLDGIVDILDYSILVNQFLLTGPSHSADMNNDEFVDILDYSILVSNFLKTGP